MINMAEFYDSNMILEILRIFKVKDVVLSNVSNMNLIDAIKKFDFNLINADEDNNNPLDVLPDLTDYDAIFIDGDANWYTVFNELNIVKQSNKEFPLVFICNNIFPNKRRDSYKDPEAIPSEFRQKFAKELPLIYDGETINIVDECYHACEENTPKNGVLTAIEDFLSENSHVRIMDINFVDGTTILYPKLQINEKRINVINKLARDDKTEAVSLPDKLIENELLVSYINKYNEYDENFIEFEDELSKKDNLIANYEKELSIKNSEMTLMDSQLKSIESKLNLKDSQIENFESKLVNNEERINTLQDRIKSNNEDFSERENSFNKKINALEGQLESASADFSKKETSLNERINALENQIKSNDADFSERENSFNEEINALENRIKSNDEDFSERENSFNKKISALEGQLESANADFSQRETSFNSQIISLENKLMRKQGEFDTLSDNIKQKDNQLKIKQQELNDVEKELSDVEGELDNLQRNYTKQLSKIDSNKYCISCFKDEISNNHLEINYLKKSPILKKILSPVAYLYLIFKSKPKELSLNIDLYKALKDSNCFDIGFYLNKNKDLIDSKWCKYFSPELHYVCEGFRENRLFNKRYFNTNSKKELLDYLLTCDK